jgi:hypothetical protein
MINCIITDDRKNCRELNLNAAKCSSHDGVRAFDNSFSSMDQLTNRHKNETGFMDNEVHILRTNQTPELIFNYEGFIKIQGRGLYSDKPEISEQITGWVERYLNNPANITYVTIALEYLNSVSTTVLVSILRKLSTIRFQSKKLEVHWYYDVEDDNILDRGRYISSSCNLPIEFIATNNVISV